MAMNNVTAYRVGGDEFALVIKDRDVREEEIQHHINVIFETPVLKQDGAASLSTSIGIAHYPQDSANVDVLINIADKRMYKMKFQR